MLKRIRKRIECLSFERGAPSIPKERRGIGDIDEAWGITGPCLTPDPDRSRFTIRERVLRLMTRDTRDCPICTEPRIAE